MAFQRFDDEEEYVGPDNVDDDYEVDEDDDGTDPCPYCGEPVHCDAILCPHCDRYLSEEDAPPEKKPSWIVITTFICLIIMVLGAFFWF